MSKNLTYIIAVFLIFTGFIFKSLFNHHLEYWVAIKFFSLFSIVIGFSVLLITLEESLKRKKLSTMSINIGGTAIRALTVLIALVLTIALEKLGESVNYQLREYYLNQSVVRTNGKINGIKRIDLVKAGEEDFYLVSFNVDGETVQKGLIVDYANMDGYKIVDQISMVDKSLFVPSIRGKVVEVIYSDKFPSFFKITNGEEQSPFGH